MGCVYLVGIMRRVMGVPGFYRDRNGVLTMMVLAHFGWQPIWMVYVLMLFSERMQYFFSPAWTKIGESAALLSNIDQLVSNVLKKWDINFMRAVHWLTHSQWEWRKYF